MSDRISRVLPLYGGGETIVDAEDWPLVSTRIWKLHTGGYAYLREPGTLHNLYLHRFLMGEPAGCIDHINRNPLDNRRENLRVVTTSVNMLNANPRRTNRSGHPGVCRSRNGKWRAYINVDYKQRWIGTFPTVEEAAAARLRAERQVDPVRFDG